MPEIRIEHISKNYHRHQALEDVSLVISEGSIHGLLGPNGAGKTSLMRILNRITLPDEGQVFFGSRLLSKEALSQIGYLPEERGLYRKMKVGEQIRYFGRLKGLSRHDARTQASRWMEKLELSSWQNRRVEELSKGMAQKVQFIVSVIHQPTVLIMDEPFSGFDPVNTRAIRSELLRMKDEGATILLSTHNMGSVESICSEITLINKGKTVVQGKLSDLKDTYRTGTFEVEFKGNIIAFTNALWTGFELVERKQLGHEHFAAYIKMIGQNDLNSMLGATMSFVKIISVKEVLPDMEDIFIRAVEKKVEAEQ